MKHRPNILAYTILVAIVATLFVARTCNAQRYYWPVALDSAAIGHWHRHTHVEVTGKVAYVVMETDGDRHIQIKSPSGAFIICECTPKEPCAKPIVGRLIVVRGISRPDQEHGWYEVHPVESWTYVP